MDGATTKGDTMRRPAQLIISATVFVDLLGFTLILPALPFYATELGATGGCGSGR
ncbi:hypothetical protein AB0K18_45115 [Nonomuraea sp. NPDC049421]|uniref:hypothetical protein n=1 Tax=Nonomuraea sp. NPDC049421 TaxID=3155275 RepID=UPI0034358D73